MSYTNALWHSQTEQDWTTALSRYWDFVQPSHLDIEREFDDLDVENVKQLNADEWYDWLLNKYFFWKYTAANRYTTTTKQLSRHTTSDDSLDNLYSIKQRLFEFNLENIAEGLKIGLEVRGLGTAGASGLLAVLFPQYFATVDQFAVYALSDISNLPERAMILRINPSNIRLSEAVAMIEIMRNKARELNGSFGVEHWTPRKIDMVLWVSSR